ncbi:MAG TPA: NADH-quinone oxidoreductase subunit N [Rhodanobacteraceae bacterium]|nr:NADH-quinone oxidoreductase subunit N [Rhodanobacteraceae bacterium]
MKLWAIIPELILVVLCLALVPLAGWLRGRWRQTTGAIALIGLAACMAMTARMLGWAPFTAFDGVYALDPFAAVFKLLIELAAFITVILLMTHFRGQTQATHAPVAVLFATLGAVALVSSNDLVAIVLFIQMMSMAGYVLVSLERTSRRANEAALKYFIYAAVALAVMAYGLSFLYGLTGSLDLRAIGAALHGADQLWVEVALALILAGYGFEVTMAPFHVWAPDVFAGASAPVAGFLSVAPKIAAMAALLRFLLVAFPDRMVGWPWWIAGGAVVSMTLGNLVALRQTRLKRLLAYSTIAQSGYVLAAVAVAGRTPEAVPAAAYYLAAYLFMNLGAFAVAAQLERAVGSDRFEALRGLGRRAPWTAALLTLFLLSLAGIPPLAGFMGKVLVLLRVIDGGMLWLAIIAAINMAIALYYYVHVIAQLYLHPPKHDFVLPQRVGWSAGYALCVAGTLGLGIFPWHFVALADLARHWLE